MKKIIVKTIIIGLLISWGLELLIPLTHTILDFIIRANLRYPLTRYLLWGYLPVVISGIYVGLSKSTNKFINGAIVGMLYYAVLTIALGAITNRHLWNGFYSFGYAFLSRGFFCAIAAWCAYRIKLWLEARKKGPRGVV